MKPFRNFGRAILCLGCLAGSVLAQAQGLRQVNPVKQAPASVNMEPYSNEYPWLSNDGKLLLWTSQPPGGVQRVWVTYIQNWENLRDAPQETTLPDLDLAPPMPLDPVNDLVDQREVDLEEELGMPVDLTIKSIAMCEEDWQPELHGKTSGSLRWRYRFTLYMSIGSPGGKKLMWRAHRIFVVVKDSTQEIIRMGDASPQVLEQVIIEDYRPNGELANEIEPMLTRDGQYLFWSSNAFNGGRIAKYIGPVSPCTQIDQIAETYDQLDWVRFPWKDQYTLGAAKEMTSKTNYHTLVERPDKTSALIFTACDGQEKCPDSENPDLSYRDCVCVDQSKKLSTTGFSGGNTVGPTLIEDLESEGLNNSGNRVAHPAISGPQNPVDDSWLLFFMRKKNGFKGIWYTKIAE